MANLLHKIGWKLTVFFLLLMCLSAHGLLVVFNALFYLMFEKALRGCFLSLLENLENRVRERLQNQGLAGWFPNPSEPCDKAPVPLSPGKFLLFSLGQNKKYLMNYNFVLFFDLSRTKSFFLLYIFLFIKGTFIH